MRDTPANPVGRSRRPRIAAVCLFVAALATPSVGAAQGASSDQVEYASAFLPPAHWSLDAARTLEGLGLAPRGFDMARAAHTQRAVAALLEHASLAIDSTADPATHALVRAWRARFARELAIADHSVLEALSGSRVHAGYRSERGGLRTGYGYETGHASGVDWNAPTSAGDLDRLEVGGALQVAPADWIAVRADGRAAEDGVFGELYASATTGPVAIWAGRRHVGYGWGHGGSVVLTGAAFDGVGVQTTRGLLLPWFLRAIGPVGFELMLADRDQPHAFENALFLTTRGTVQPHERLSLGVTRAVEFGGEGNTEADWFAVFSVLVGKHAGVGSEFDNQVAAVDASFRLPTERWVPLRAYVEWGFEDSAGAWQDVPGLVLGVEVPAFPGAPWLRAALERTHFADECCGNPIWYRNLSFVDGWTREGRPMGHPLGGEGTEWLGSVGAHLLDARLRTEVRIFSRERGVETLYEPIRQGNSSGGSARIDWTFVERAEIFLEASREDGDGWTESALLLGLTAIL